MTDPAASAPRFTVYLHAELERELCSTAIFPECDLEKLYGELPQLHPVEAKSRQRKHRLPKRPRVFRGHFDCSNSGFTYLQIGNRLHIVEFWLDRRLLRKRGRPPMDVVIGKLPKSLGRHGKERSMP